jgi:hypothetical protein
VLTAIERGVHETAAHAVVRSTAAPAIVGSALLVLDELGADESAKVRVRRELTTEAATIGGRDG